MMLLSRTSTISNHGYQKRQFRPESEPDRRQFSNSANVTDQFVSEAKCDEKSSANRKLHKSTRFVEEPVGSSEMPPQIRDPKLKNRRPRKAPGPPKCFYIAKAAYHKYGGKHIMLILILISYAFLGAIVFYILEEKEVANEQMEFQKKVDDNRTVLIRRLFKKMFNDTKKLPMIMIDGRQTKMVNDMVEDALRSYEVQLGVKPQNRHQTIEWNFWNAMLYAGTLCTTIGYGYLYPVTTAGRIATMIYALFGIPLVLSVLDNLGKLLTVGLKYPWLMFKKLCRRAARPCTKQSWEEIRHQDAIDWANIDVFDLPIPVALALVIAWIFVCSATFCIWEKDWDYFIAFYFFFISLSTIGLGDITPDRPGLLLVMFFYIIIGLSLVSMCINLIQIKLVRTYESGKDSLTGDTNANLKTRKKTLGIFQSNSVHSIKSFDSLKVPNLLNTKNSLVGKSESKLTQTILCLPAGKGGLIRLPCGYPLFIPTSSSVDDVMRLENDLIVLTALTDETDIDRAAVTVMHLGDYDSVSIAEDASEDTYHSHSDYRIGVSKSEVVPEVMTPLLDEYENEEKDKSLPDQLAVNVVEYETTEISETTKLI